MTCGIYKITNKVNGKIYIGQSVDVERRWKGHKKLSKSKDGHLYSAIRKCGIDNFTFSIICEVPENVLGVYEISYIKYYETTDRSKGYNKTFGGEGGKKTDETKQKMSNAQKGKVRSEESKRKMSDVKRKMSAETKRKMSNAKKGKVLSNETKIRISNSEKGKVLSNETKEKMSNAKKGKPKSAETKMKMSESQIKRRRAEKC